MLKTSAIGLAGMVLKPRLFSNKRDPNSKMVATRVETAMNDCVLFAQITRKSGERVSASDGEEYNGQG